MMLANTALDFGAIIGALAQVTDPDYINEAGRIIGTPAAGPKPEHPGDRGGYAQLLTLLMLALGVSFIGWRVWREARRNQAARSAPR